MHTRPMRGVVEHARHALRPPLDGEAGDAELLRAFVDRRDGPSFEVLVRRHGRMVLAVCRRILGDHHDAEDAFQATFLVLVRKAGSVRRGATLGPWLHRVACRLALHARALRANRRAREDAVSPLLEPAMIPATPTSDLRPLLDAELDRLPEKYRVAVTLCDLEGLTRRAAAERLGVAEGTLSGRLTTAHRRLARRLAHRGLAATGATLAAALTAEAAEPSPALLAAVVRSAIDFAAGAVADIPAPALALTKGALNAMFLRKIKMAALAMVALSFAIAGVGAWIGPALFARPSEKQPQPPLAAKAEPPRAPMPKADEKPEPKPPESSPPKVRTLTGFTTTVYVAFGNENTLATYSEKSIRLWDTTSRTVRHQLLGHLGFVCSASFSPDGKTLATSDASTVRFWDVDSGEQREVQAGPLAGTEKLAYSPNGKLLACVGGHGEIRIWDIGAAKLVRTFNAEHPKNVPIVTLWIAYSPDGKFVAQCHTDGHPGPSYLRLWDPETGKLERTLIDGSKSSVWSAVFSPDGKLLAAGEDSGRITLFETKRWQKLGELEGKDMLRGLAFSADSRTLAAGMRRDIQLWDTLTGKRLRALEGHGNWAASLSFSADGKTLASGSSDKTAKLWPMGEY